MQQYCVAFLQHGQVCLIIPASRAALERDRPEVSNLTDDELLQWVIGVVLPKRGPHQIILRDAVPRLKEFREAWTMQGSGIVVDMAQARLLQMDRIRAARNAKLDQLDKDWMRAVGQGNTTGAATIEAQRQVLRDLPQMFDLSTATTPEALQARWPNQLPRL